MNKPLAILILSLTPIACAAPHAPTPPAACTHAACTYEGGAWHPTSPPPPACEALVPADTADGDADLNPGFMAWVRRMGGNLSYSGDGSWGDAHDKIIGYSTFEDSTIYASRTAAEACPAY